MPLMEFCQKDVWNETIYKKILHAQPFSSIDGTIRLSCVIEACAGDDKSDLSSNNISRRN